jgi:type VI protein secretion system component Hcp
MAAAAQTAVFEIEGAKAEVLNFSYSFARGYDEKGQPMGIVRAGSLSLSLHSHDKETKGKIIKWMESQDVGKTGKVTIYRDEKQEKVFKEVEFENAYVVGYSESFNGQGTNMIESFDISAENIKVEGAEFKMKWPDTE